MIAIQEVIAHLEKWAPRDYAEDFDNTGLLTGDPSAEVKGVLVTLDCLETVVNEAIEKGCNLIVSFHPIIFNGLKNLSGNDYVSRAVVKAIKNDVAIYSTHTALDNAMGGVSHEMAKRLTLDKIRTLIPKSGVIKKLQTYVPKKDLEKLQAALFYAGAGNIGNYSECSFSAKGKGTFMGGPESNPTVGERGVRVNEKERLLSVTFEARQESNVIRALHEAHPYEEVAYEIVTLDNKLQTVGMGAIGELPEALTVVEFLELIMGVFNTGGVRYSSEEVWEGSSLSRKRKNKPIKTVAVLGGSGAFAINPAIRAGADVLVTADLKYHDFFTGQNILLCDVGHYESEQFTIPLLQSYLSEKFTTFATLCAEARTNPVNYL